MNDYPCGGGDMMDVWLKIPEASLAVGETVI